MRNLISCVVFTALLLSWAGCCAPAYGADEPDSIKTYQDIPGVTEAEIAAIETLKNSRNKFSFGQMLETEAFILPDGSYAGFAIKFCDLLSGLFGIEFAFELHDWESLINGLDAKQIDFTGDMTPTPERMRFYCMSNPIALRSLRIYTFSENEILTEKEINGRRVGYLTGSVDATVVKHYYPELVLNIVDIDSIDLAVAMMKSGAIDVFVCEGVIDPLIDEYGSIQSREFFPLVSTKVSLTTANPDLNPVITVLDKYLSAGGSEDLFRFYLDGHDEYIRHKLRKTFTEGEKAFIDNHTAPCGRVSIALEHDNYPFSFFNRADKEFQGIAVDVLSEICRLTGIELEVTNYNISSWAEIFGMLQSGKVSLVSQLLFSEERRGHFLWTEYPYTSAFYALLSKSDFPDLAIHQVPRTKVGFTSKTAFEDKYHQWFPGSANTSIYNTQTETLDALEAGEIDLVMGSEYMLLNQQNYREKHGYKVNIRFGIPMESYFGINKNEEILCSIINKSQLFVDTDIITSKWASRGYDYVKELAKQRLRFFMLLAVALSFILLLTAIFLARHRKLNRSLDNTVRERTRDLERQTRAAQVASKSKSVFLATMSHEIKTPLNAILGMADVAKKAMPNPVKVAASIDQIQNSSHHLLSLIDNVLDMAQIDAGKLELSCAPFDSQEAYADVLSIIGQRCLDKKINFIHPKNEIRKMTLMGDKQRLNQVLLNLLENAVKFTPEGGEITFSITALEEDDENIKCHFSVSDTGIGMTEEQTSRLFVPFEQVDSDVAAKYGGSGLGLSISQNLVGMMGGTIKAESTLNAGSNFHFDLSFSKVMDIIEEEATLELADLFGKRILLVDDIEINRTIIAELLTPVGIEIEEAENGQQAIDKLCHSPFNHYDLIFKDLQMPVMGGLEAAQKIRSLDHPDSGKIPIIAVSANAFKDDVEAALSSGMNGHIAKPVSMEAVMNILIKFIKPDHEKPGQIRSGESTTPP